MRCMYLTFCMIFLAMRYSFAMSAAVQTDYPPQSLLQLLKEHVLMEALDGKIVYILNQPLHANSLVTSWQDTYSVPGQFEKAWFIFVDDLPNANWEHACRYVFIDVETKDYTIEQGRTPPTVLGDMILLYP
ncbi:hypothetical protein C8R11_12130 [Nitrosomonas aestuarii]|nr:hypothetical protein C8R11_12130 [Nitrosomonas aestuarii]